MVNACNAQVPSRMSVVAPSMLQHTIVSKQVERMLPAELQRGLKRRGVVVKTWQQFADHAVLKRRGSHFPWWTCLMTYTLCIIFFFMAGEPK